MWKCLWVLQHWPKDEGESNKELDDALQDFEKQPGNLKISFKGKIIKTREEMKKEPRKQFEECMTAGKGTQRVKVAAVRVIDLSPNFRMHTCKESPSACKLSFCFYTHYTAYICVGIHVHRHIYTNKQVSK